MAKNDKKDKDLTSYEFKFKSDYESKKIKARERAKQWRIDNPEKYRENQLRWARLNLEKKREYAKQYSRTHAEDKAEYDKKYYQMNRDKKNQQTRAWRLANPELTAIYKRRWVEKNPLEMILMRHARRAKVAGGRINKKDIANWESRLCGVCEGLIQDKFHIDHKVPLSRGGEHIVSNLQLAHPTCNLKKHNKLPSELQGAF